MSEYSALEEKINIYSHLFGAIMGVVGLILLVIKSFGDYSVEGRLSFIIFGLSLVALYLASTNYHRTQDLKIRSKRKIIDHCAIYILIAGTYTPFALALLDAKLGWLIFGLSWGMALVGVILKLFFTGRFKIISTMMYLLMGWMIILFIRPLMEVLTNEGFNWLLAGGILYTIGALAYVIKKIKLNHAIFHIFILAASFCHFVSVYFYL